MEAMFSNISLNIVRVKISKAICKNGETPILKLIHVSET